MNVNLHHITDGVAYWVLFWTVINMVLPPREVFADDSGNIPRWYNILLKLVAYYGAMNLRSVTVKLYSAVNQAPDPLQTALSNAAKATETVKKDSVKATEAIATAQAVAPTPEGK